MFQEYIGGCALRSGKSCIQSAWSLESFFWGGPFFDEGTSQTPQPHKCWAKHLLQLFSQSQLKSVQGHFKSFCVLDPSFAVLVFMRNLSFFLLLSSSLFLFLSSHVTTDLPATSTFMKIWVVQPSPCWMPRNKFAVTTVSQLSASMTHHRNDDTHEPSQHVRLSTKNISDNADLQSA